MMIEETNNHWWTGELEHPYGRGMNLQIEVSDVSAIIERLDKANITLFRPLRESWYRGEDMEYGQLEFLVQDPDGYLLRFIQDTGERDRKDRKPHRPTNSHLKKFFSKIYGPPLP